MDLLQTHAIPRDLLAKYFGHDPRLVSAFENQALAVMESQAGLIAATETLDQASVITLSPNDAFGNEYVLANGDGTQVEAGPGTVKVSVNKSVARSLNYKTAFQPPGDVTLGLPSLGTLVSDAAPAVMRRKTLEAPKLSGLVNAASDAAASGAGVPIGGVYHNAGALRVRLV